MTPTSETAVEYFLAENSKDYVQMPAKALKFLDEHGLLDGVESALELRTYGGGLLAILRERGVAHVEGGYIQEFDGELARRLFGIENLTQFSFAQAPSSSRPPRAEYDLILGYEALTHPDPVGLLELDPRPPDARGRPSSSGSRTRRRTGSSCRSRSSSTTST